MINDAFIECLAVVESENRDVETTWLWIGQGRYVDVNPFELLQKALENLPPSDAQQHCLQLLNDIHDIALKG